MEGQQSIEDQLAPVFNKRPTNYQPNLFTESKQEFTELEKKIVVLVVNQIGYLALKGELMPIANVIVNIPFSSLTRDHHQQIADAAESLQSKRLVYRDDSRNKLDFITPFPRVRSEICGWQASDRTDDVFRDGSSLRRAGTALHQVRHRHHAFPQLGLRAADL